MEDPNTQEVAPQQAAAYPGATQRKVLQPSAAIVEEMKAAATTTGQPQASPQTPPQAAAPLNSAPPEDSLPPSSSIYPEATRGVGISTPTPTPLPPSNELSRVDEKLSSKILAVRVVAGALIVLDAVNAYNWYLEKRAGYTSWTNVIGVAIGLALTIGIFRLSEAARAAYVVLSFLLLALAGIGLIVFYSSVHTSPSAVSNTSSLTTTELRNSIKTAQDNQSLPPSQRQAIVRTLQAQIARQSGGSPVDVKLKQFVSFGLSVAVAIGPLIFFTRPSVKEVFG